MSATDSAWASHLGPDYNSRQHRRTCFDAGWAAGRADLEARGRALVEAAEELAIVSEAIARPSIRYAKAKKVRAALAPFQEVKP